MGGSSSKSKSDGADEALLGNDDGGGGGPGPGPGMGSATLAASPYKEQGRVPRDCIPWGFGFILNTFAVVGYGLYAANQAGYTQTDTPWSFENIRYEAGGADGGNGTCIMPHDKIYDSISMNDRPPNPPSYSALLFGPNSITTVPAPITAAPPIPQPATDKDFENTLITAVAVAMALSLFFGILTLLGFRRAPKKMVWLVILLKILFPSIPGFFLLVNDPYSSPLCATEHDAGKCHSWLPFLFFGISGFVALIFCCYRRTINLVARLFQVSSAGLQENPNVVTFSIVLGAIATTVKVLFLSILVLGYFDYLGAEVKIGKQYEKQACYRVCTATDPHGEACIGTKDPHIENTYCCIEPSVSAGFWWWFSFSLVWVLMFLLEQRRYVISGVMAQWYFNHSQEGRISRSVRHSWTTSFGTIAFASFVLTVAEFVKAAAKKAQKQKGANALVKCVAACTICIMNIIEDLTDLAVIRTAITGEGLMTAGSSTTSMITRSFGAGAQFVGVWNFPRMILHFYVFFFSLATGFVSYRVFL